jgi:aryl-alcohol dehydrogenase-like predicted oxidoreductase
MAETGKRATPDGTSEYMEWATGENRADRTHFRSFLSLNLTSLGMGTYLGEADAETDRLVEEAVYRSVASGGINVVDTAINYRFQKAERSVGRAARRLIGDGVVRRDGLFISTKGGYLTSDADLQPDFWSYIQRELIRPGKLKPEEIAGDVHSMSPSFLRDQFERSLKNLGMECIDLLYLHNAPESWLPEVGYRRFLERLGDAFSVYEEERRKGRLGYYGLATWSCLRVSRDEADHVNLDDVVDVARTVSGDDHGFRFIQLPFNIAMSEALLVKNQRIADEPLTAFEAAERLGVGVFTSAPLAEGRLLGHTRVPEMGGSRALSLLQFARSAHPSVVAPLVGQKEPKHIAENLGLAHIPPLERDQFRATYGPLLS